MHLPILLSILLVTLLPEDASASPQPPQPTLSAPAETRPVQSDRPREAHGRPNSVPATALSTARVTSPARVWRRGAAVSVQVNVNEEGNNIPGDAANEPSIAVDLNNNRRQAIGWRQFNSLDSDFTQAGWGFTDDAGQTWTAGILDPGVARTGPVLDVDTEGNFYYSNRFPVGSGFSAEVFRSSNGGASWDTGVFAQGGAWHWMTVDRSEGLGNGHVYLSWIENSGCCGPGSFTRSTDGGESFESSISVPGEPKWGTAAVGPAGEVYVVGVGDASDSQVVSKSTTLRDPALPPAFDSTVPVDLGGFTSFIGGPNPTGLLGKIWIAVDTGSGPRSGWVYILANVHPPGSDPFDIHFVRSEDGGATWSEPVRINDDPPGNNAWQWFGALAVAPNGRLDAIWNDARDDLGGFDSALYYSYSKDGGVTWSANEAISPTFDPHLGWPQETSIGDSYDMVSENDVIHVAYAATFNGEQDIYYLRLPAPDPIFTDGFESGDTTAWSSDP